MKNFSIPVNDRFFEKFVAIQKGRGFKNQSDTLEFIIELAAKSEAEKR